MTQTEYLEILLNDYGFNTRAQRNAWLSRETGRTIKFLDELTKVEAHAFIEVLKARRAETVSAARQRREQEDEENL